MKLAEALDELRAGILRDFSTIKSGPPDVYWTDDRLVLYINEAHKRFARMALCIRDDVTPEATQVALASGVDIYPLHSSVMMVLSARHQDDSQDMVRISHQRAVNSSNTFTEDFDYAIVTNPGKPLRFSTDEGLDPTTNHAIRMRFLGVPDATQVGKVIFLRVIRQPLKALLFDDTEACFETPEDYDLDVLEWAAYRALRNWDIDAEDRAKAVQHKDRFNEAVKECKRDVLRKVWQPLTWKFGGAGFGGYIKN